MYKNLTKYELRVLYKEKRMALSRDEVNFLSKKLLENFILQFNPIENQRVNVFLSIKKFNEVNTQIFINYFFENKLRVFVPKIQDNELISVEIFPDSAFEINSWGIKEPTSSIPSNVDLDYVLTPLLYSDEYGNRVGYGKGFYDHFFTEYANISKKIGLNFFPPNEIIFDIHENDVRIDALITPLKTLIFNSNY